MPVFLGAVGMLASAGSPPERLLLATLGVYAVIEAGAGLAGANPVLPGDSRLGRMVWLATWPGISVEPFRRRQRLRPDPGLLTGGLTRVLVGVAAGLLLASHAALLPVQLTGWAGIACLLLVVHLGLLDLLTAGLHRLGFAAARPFDAPWRSRTLAEFWGRRWNAPFAEMNRLLLLPAARRRLDSRGAVLAAFAASAFLHEMAISYPVRAGWGGPSAYFLLHGVLVTAEPSLGIRRWPSYLARAWTWAWVLVPLPLLFHAPFRDGLVVPLFLLIGGIS